MRFRSLPSRLLVSLVLINLAAPVSGLFAQRRTGSATASNKTAAAPKCSGAWTGSITYTRAQSATNNKTVERVSARGQDTTNWEMKYNYSAKVAVVESPEKNGSSIGKATIDHNFSSKETVKAEEKNSCDRGKTWKTMTGDSTSETKTSGQGTEAANINVGVNSDGTYTVSVALPQIQGQTTGTQTTTFSGQCTPKEGKTFNMPPTTATIDGNSLTSDGTNRVDPNDPNRLSGSYSKTWQNVTETITWSLQKCGAPLRLMDLKFEDMKFPTWNAWKEITEQAGTIDGNLVKIKAKVLNASGETKYADVRFKETYKGDKWDGARPDAPLDDNVVSVRLEAGEEREVEMVWDSSGYAWFDDGRPRLVQRIKAELEENGKKTDEMTRNLKVAPKPLVLVHGLWSNWKAWESWQNILTTSHSYDWKAFPVGEKPEKGVMDTGGSFMSTAQTKSIGDNAHALESYIRYAQEDRNAWHVDVVAHSLGGLISRWYIDQLMGPSLFNKAIEDGRPQISHLVMLGTPNMGSPCADVMDIAFGMVGKQVEAVRQLQTDYVAGFNKVHTARKGVKFSALAGDALPTMCKSVVWNDGVVSVESALWNIKDTAKTKSLHTELTGTSDFSSFVKPHVAIGPKGNHNPDVPTGAQAMNFKPTADLANAPMSMPRMYGMHFSATDLIDPRPPEKPFAKLVKLQPKESAEIELPVAAVQNLGITFMAPSVVSATLLNEKGIVVGKNLANSPEAAQWFRSIYMDKGITAGTWKVKLENTGDREMEVVLTAWSDAVK